MPTNDLSIPLLELRGLTKRFGGTLALNDVSFTVTSGEVHAVCGENGAGKSTLMKILAGVHPPDSGEILLNGQAVHFRSPADSQRAGVAIVFQELSQFPHLTVAENLFSNREPSHAGLIDRRSMRKAAREALERMETRIDPNARISELTLAERQLVEIARALMQNARVVILDEPNSALAAAETERLMALVRRLREEGTTFLYVSHRMEEVFSISDAVTVLRDGKFVSTRPLTETSIPQVISEMIGRPADHVFDELPTTEGDGKPILEARGLRLAGGIGPLDLSLAPGRVTGVAGIEGSGVTELFEALFGLRKVIGGELLVGGKDTQLSSPNAAIDEKIALVPPSRRDQGLMMEWSVARNANLQTLDRLRTPVGTLSGNSMRRQATELVERLGVVTEGVWKPVTNLSGGNQQKVLLAKWLATQPRILMLNDPTRGVDVGAKAEIYKLIRSLAAEGVAILLTSSEYEEIVGLCDDVYVLRDGRVVKKMDRGEATKAALMAWALGGTLDSQVEAG
jgi:ABC-type sugar transport system ATPase subunit